MKPDASKLSSTIDYNFDLARASFKPCRFPLNVTSKMGKSHSNAMFVEARLDLATSPTVANHSHRKKRRYEHICIDCLICLDKREYTKNLPTNFKSLPAWGLLVKRFFGVRKQNDFPDNNIANSCRYTNSFRKNLLLLRNSAIRPPSIKKLQCTYL